MATSELGRIGEIDRSEHVTREYTYREGELRSGAVDVRIPSWARVGDDDRSVEGNVAAWRPVLERGGALIGAFDAGLLIGFAIHRPDLAEGVANLAALYVSRSHRREGIASRLLAEVQRLARTGGARLLYVSATPSGATVDFYRSHGFEPTDEPDEAMFAAEPEDIHMILALD